jgi:RHS repeat-associated protein
LTSDGSRTLTWDAENRLISITNGTHTSTFSYDGLSRRVAIIEADNGTTTSDTKFVWCGLQICEARHSSGTVLKRYFDQGVQASGMAYFYTRDHLGSVREMSDSAGAVRARYDYDPRGRRVKSAGDQDADLGFGGMFMHAPSGLLLTLFRAYDPNLGSWISEDPLGIVAGANRYAYVSNRITVLTDPFGLQQGRSEETTWQWLWRVYVKELFSSYIPAAVAETATEAGKAAGKAAGSQAMGAAGDVVESSTTFLEFLTIQMKHNQQIDQALKCISDPSCGTVPPNQPPVTPWTPPPPPPNECR